VDRPLRDSRFLGEHGGQIYILRLQGFIFFGTANHLLHKVRLRANDSQLPALKFAVLDFRRVTGLDSSAIFSLSKVQHLADKQGFALLMSQVSPQIVSQIEKSRMTFNRDDSLRLLPDLDHALEWCENRLLTSMNGERNGHTLLLAEQLKESWPAAAEPRRLMPYLERLEVSVATHLIRQSERSESLYFIESGLVTVRLEFEDGRTLRLRTMGAGTVVGEVGLFLGGVRTASVITEQPCTVYRLTHDSLQRMNVENPDLALAFHRYLICLLGERLTSSSKILRGVIE
jgi:sulfate permease, SulP family